MLSVAIIGAGDLGGATAQALASRDRVGRLLLIDAAAGAAAGKALDLRQAGAIDRSHTALEGTDDLSRVTGCHVCVVADRFASGSPEWQGEEALALLGRLNPYLGAMPVVFAGAVQSDLVAAAARELGIPPGRLIGSAPEGFAAAARGIVAMEARCSARDVSLTVLGAPPRLMVPWSEASIGGYALERTLDQVQLNRLEGRLPSLWPPGPYTLGLAAGRVTEAILESSRSAVAVLTMLNGEFGVTNRIGTVPALLSSSGIVHTRTPALNTRERVMLGL
jgi:malate dehydrogenase